MTHPICANGKQQLHWRIIRNRASESDKSTPTTEFNKEAPEVLKGDNVCCLVS